MPNSIKVLFSLVVTLSALYWWSLRSVSSGELSGRGARVFPNFIRARVDEIAISRGQENYRLLRVRAPGAEHAELELGDFFVVQDGERRAADVDKVSLLFSAFEYADAVREFAAERPSNWGSTRLRGAFLIGTERYLFELGQREVRGEGAYLKSESRYLVAATDLEEALDHNARYYFAVRDAGVDDVAVADGEVHE